MSVNLSEEVKSLFLDKDSIKVLASTDENGDPHAVFKGSIHINEEGKVVYLELIESSTTNRNLVSSIWFDKKVAINIVNKDKKSYQIKGRPIKAIISGSVFQKYYKFIQEKLEGGSDLSTVWIIDPESVVEETFQVRREKEEKEHPLLRHLDRLT